MKRAEFIKAYVQQVEQNCHRWVKEKTMRPSEAAMTMADAPDRAKQTWRAHRKTFATMTAEELFK